MRTERLQELIASVVLWRARVRGRGAARQKRDARAAAIRQTRGTLEAVRRLGAGDTDRVVNVGLYLLLLDDDLGHFAEDMLRAARETRRRFIAKQQAVLLYEAAEDLPQLLGREFREAAKGLGASLDQMKRLSAASSGLNRFWQEHRGMLQDIRQALAAHREHDALSYLERLDALKPLEIMSITADFSVLLNQLLPILTELAALTRGEAAVLSDMGRSRSRSPR